MKTFADLTVHKIFKGAYNYYQQDTQYAEETFELWEDPRELSKIFISQIVSRIATGELLKIDVEYTVNKEWVPERVIIKKNLGKQTAIEKFKFISGKNIIEYTFTDFDGNETFHTISTPPRFHISTQACCSNFFFLLSKKFDINGKNNYMLYSSVNQWLDTTELQQNHITIYKNSASSPQIVIGKSILTGDEYFFEVDRLNNQEAPNTKKKPMRLYLSKYFTIPYLIEDPEHGLKAQIKYLTNLSDE